MPRVINSDCGLGFYLSSTGHIVRQYFDALKAHGFRAYAGTDASDQPPDMPDIFPHETVVAWARTFMKKHPLIHGKGLDDMQCQLSRNLTACAQHINSQFQVHDLVRHFPDRLQEVIDRKGDRLPR